MVVKMSILIKIRKVHLETIFKYTRISRYYYIMYTHLLGKQASFFKEINKIIRIFHLFL